MRLTTNSLAALLLIALPSLTPILATAAPAKDFAIRITHNDRTDEATPKRGGAPLPETPADVLFLPFFEVNSSAGIVSLFAIRNVTDSDIFIQTDFDLSDGGFFRSDVEVLKAHATSTVNLGDVFPDNTIGAAATFVTDSNGTEIPVKAIVGDFFLVNPANDFAVGDVLATRLCNRTTTRFASGGVFDGTSFTFGVTNFIANEAPGFDPDTGFAPFATFKVYDEAGDLISEGTLLTTTGILKVSTADLVLAGIPLPTFGSIEWVLESGHGGNTTWSMNASSKFSVGMTGTCLEPPQLF